MFNAQQMVDRQYHEMRWRILSLAADLDRIQRADGASQVLSADARLKSLRACVEQLLSPEVGRAERVQMILSDMTPPPPR
jgi:hypothetical protein